MKKIVGSWFILVGLLLGSAGAHASVTPIYYHQNDVRHPYQIELLEHILALTDKEFGQARAVHKALPSHRAGVGVEYGKCGCNLADFD